MRRFIVAVTLAAAAGAAQAEVYRCTNAAGDAVYQGRPCPDGGQKLDNLVVSPGVPESAAERQANPLAERYQARMERLRDAQAKRAAEAKLKIERDRLVRELIRKELVGPGMTPDEVRQSWGAPSDIETRYGSYGTSQMWIYRTGFYSANYVHFDDGLVTSVSLD